ncbi:MAG: AAA family ATPase, partial [Chloroflexi bacterium]|nr:AAA family ATPase [Chloroflexota bacterium]
MRSFDARERVPTWPGWALRPNERWGIRFEDRLYPVKRIVSAVTRVPVSRFSGGMQHANRYVEGYGFEVRRLEAPAPAVEPAVPDLQAVAARVKQVAAGLFLEPPNYLDDVLDLLIDRRQVIFYGPPGTGKTYIARKLAEACAGAKDRVTPVQFHPSYSYEDFVWGYRPKADGTFRLEDGPLLVAARAAREQPGEIHVILIDEFNRGNIAKVFGELYYLLEYRDEDLQLQYGRQEKFRLPKNLWFIGTMNAADRSIALLDAALRRRFYFVEFF